MCILKEVIPIIMSAIALVFSALAVIYQIKSYKNNVKPIIDIIIGDYDNNIYVKLVNNGIGPAIIKELKCVYLGDIPLIRKQTSTLIELLMEEGATSSVIESYSTFVEDVMGRTMPPNDEIILVQIKNGSQKDNVALRLMLQNIEVQVYYEDMYNRIFYQKRLLDFFARTL